MTCGNRLTTDSEIAASSRPSHEHINSARQVCVCVFVSLYYPFLYVVTYREHCVMDFDRIERRRLGRDEIKPQTLGRGSR